MEIHDVPIKILLIEDHPPDIKMIQKAVLSSKLTYHLTVISRGDDAIDFIHRDSRYHKEFFVPDIILLDWVLPSKTGSEVLKEIKDSIDMRHVPVIVMLNDSVRADVLMSYQNYANAVIKKPLRSSEMNELVSSIEQFWFISAELPKLQK